MDVVDENGMEDDEGESDKEDDDEDDGDIDEVESHTVAVKPNPDHILYRYAKASPEFTELFGVWDTCEPRNAKLRALIVDLIASVILHVSPSSASFAARKIIKSYLPGICMSFSSESTQLIEASLKLCFAVVSVSDNITREFKSKFNFGHKGFIKV
jgi:hypothetical protein